MARQYRPGQTKNCVYYHLVARNTIDETVIRAREKKNAVIEAVLRDAVADMSDGESLMQAVAKDVLSLWEDTPW